MGHHMGCAVSYALQVKVKTKGIEALDDSDWNVPHFVDWRSTGLRASTMLASDNGQCLFGCGRVQSFSTTSQLIRGWQDRIVVSVPRDRFACEFLHPANRTMYTTVMCRLNDDGLRLKWCDHHPCSVSYNAPLLPREAGLGPGSPNRLSHSPSHS